jgi:hypothetical protein
MSVARGIPKDTGLLDMVNRLAVTLDIRKVPGWPSRNGYHNSG